MNIFMQYSPISFKANPNSPRLRFAAKDFYVNIKGYGKNKEWANVIIETADAASKAINRGENPENVLKSISYGVKNANKFEPSMAKVLNTGILRTERTNWKCEITKLFTYFGAGQYKSYFDRLIAMRDKPLATPRSKIAMTRPLLDTPELQHGEPEYINKTLERVFKISHNLFSNFNYNNIKNKDLERINFNIAEIRWLLAHATPWKRGSDAISNVFIRAIYKSLGIKTYPLEKGITLDLEAYCTELNQYKKVFTTYFKKPPTIIE